MGMALCTYEHGATQEPWAKTCPRWCSLLLHVQQVQRDLDDYDRGALGNVRELEAPYLEYLRAASKEREIWRSENERQMYKKQ